MNSRNPFDNEWNRVNSSYARCEADNLIFLDRTDPVPPFTQFVHAQFRSLALNEKFPCIGARAAFKNNAYRFGLYAELGSPEATAGLCRDLYSFVQDQANLNSDFTTFVASFSGPATQDEKHFERLLWTQLQSLHDQDKHYHKWDPEVSDDPENPLFSFSFAGRAFFIVGLHAGSSRWSRRFAWPTVVFNAHFQFENLRKTGRFERFKKVIRNRDLDLQGNINPNLTDFGNSSEACQYSGRPVEHDWKCPFHTQGDNE